MNTLVYFASGPNKEHYQYLPFDKIYLIDNCFKNQILYIGKIICLGMDCLKSIDYLKKYNVKIDYFVSLNEGLYEGGGRYAINSDMFLGYAMPLFNNEYFHIMNKNYYLPSYHVTMDLPYKKYEIEENDINYLNPFIFSENFYQKGYAKVFRMLKNRIEKKLNINDSLKIKIINDSIWVDYNNLEKVVLSLSQQGQRDFFKKIPNVIDINEMSFSTILDFCDFNKISIIGLTPWMRGKYQSVIEELKNYNCKYPKEIRFYHLNANDYEEFKKNL